MLRIDQILAEQYRGTPIQPVVELARLCRAWPSLQGEPWGSASWPLRLLNGTLHLGVADPSWAQRMVMDKRRIKQRVERYLGYEVALRHRLVPVPAAQPEPEKTEPIWDDPHVLTAVRDVPEGPLRAALQSYLAHLAAFQKRNGLKSPTEESP